MEVAMELEDDLFFADLNKQISLLIMDDDDHDRLPHCPSDSLQSIPRSVQYPNIQSSIYNQQQICTREISKGTGVFIPRSSHPRRKSKQGKRGSSNTAKSNRQIAVNSRGTSYLTYNANSPYASNFNSY
ncbi:hypothetical protein Ancab_013406 [Ancistrocladus abbreviatus]